MKITKFGTLTEVAGQLMINGFGFQFNGESGNDSSVMADALCAYIREKLTTNKAPALMNSTLIMDFSDIDVGATSIHSVFGGPSPEWIAENLYLPTRNPTYKIAIDPYRHECAVGNSIKELTKPSGDKIAIDPMAEFVRQVRR